MSVRLVVLDRDGVINHDSTDYIRSPAEWRAIDGSLEAIAHLTRAGYTVAVATNQSGIGRGYFDIATLSEMHDNMRAMAAAEGGRIDRVVYCPHRPDEHCDCRKPAAGMLRQLGLWYGIGLQGVPVVGDSDRDLLAAQAVGARPVLVRTGNGARTEKLLAAKHASVEVYDNLLQFALAVTNERGWPE